jgi:hypothetical protein
MEHRSNPVVLWAMALPPIFIAIAVAALSFHVLMCLYIITNAGAVASEIAKPSRSFMAWIYLRALSVFRNDPEMDLVQTGLPYDAIVANCRRRAMMSLGVSLAGTIAVIVLLTSPSLFTRF